MKTYPLKDDDNGFQFGFEIDNIYIGLNKIVTILSYIEGVSNIKRRRLFDFSNKNHIKFNYLGSKFAVCEPYGDNSRYWIAPLDKINSQIDVSDIEDAFKKYNIPILKKMIGDMFSLNFKNLLMKG